MRWIVVAIATTALAAGALPAVAETSGTVAAHVTVASPCLTVSPGEVDFGVKGFSNPNANEVNSYVDGITVATCSGTDENLLTRGTDATGAGGAKWSLTSGESSEVCPTPNLYHLSLFNLPGPPFVEFRLTSQDQAFGRVFSGSARSLRLNMEMPCSGSSGGGQVMSFSVIFTVTL